MKGLAKGFVPATRVGLALYVVSMSAWIVTGVIAALGGIAWPVATFLSIALTIPVAIHQTFFTDDEDD